MLIVSKRRGKEGWREKEIIVAAMEIGRIYQDREEGRVAWKMAMISTVV